jgi:DNA (cytosine-5)-methyltransferase 1
VSSSIPKKAPEQSLRRDDGGQGKVWGTCVELFSGGGGLALALHNAGFSHLLLNEINHHACSTLLSNRAVRVKREELAASSSRRKWPLIEGGIESVDFVPLAQSVDIVAGGVPCQPFSLGGAHQGHLDERNLWPEFLRCVRETRPKVILAENVRGLLRPSFNPYWEYIQRSLSLPFEERIEGESWSDHDRRLVKTLKTPVVIDEGYNIEFKLVNAADFGVPQNRHRVILVGFRKDLGVDWSFPDPTHSKASLEAEKASGRYYEKREIKASRSSRRIKGEDGQLPWLTLRDAIFDLPEPKELKESEGYLHHVGWPGAREYRGHTANDLDIPAKTVKAGVHGVPGGETVVRLDDGRIRYLTVREVARVMTFPDEWKLSGTRGEQVRQLGNAVPVKLGEVVAKSIADMLRKDSPR